jgi:hypothetical protein
LERTKVKAKNTKKGERHNSGGAGKTTTLASLDDEPN